jgi:hypothetical protein
MEMTLHALPRNNAHATFEVDPAAYRPKKPIPEALRQDKTLRNKWATAPTTKHCFYSGFDGENPAIRIRRDNPVSRMRAIVVDYDRSGMDFREARQQVMDCQHLDIAPNYITSTLSGGIRLVWALEEPLNMDTGMAKRFLKIAEKELSLNKLLPGLDVGALEDPTKYYEVGENWDVLNSEYLPNAVALTWSIRAVKGQTFSSALEAQVPLDRAEAALRKEYPDVDFPKFEIGMRMHRFWDASASNDSAAVLTEGGFFCHTGLDKFMGWEQLLGPQFMREFETEQTGQIVEDFWYNGQSYLRAHPLRKGEWMIKTPSEMSLHLSAHYGLSRSTKKGMPSEVEKVMHSIQMLKGVDGFASCAHYPSGELDIDGRKVVNVSRIKAMDPGQNAGQWGDNFPWLAQFLDNMLVNQRQLHILLAWWKRFYTGALAQSPTRGQILFIAGPPSCGKTLFSTKMLAPSVGGGIDAGDFYLNGDDFGGTYFEKGLHLVDDVVAGNFTRSDVVANRYKKVAATTRFTVNQKYEKRSQCHWSGRVCVTMNSDTESLKTLPQLQTTLEDKIIILRASNANFDLLESTKDIDGTVARELPHLLRWLLDWDVPQEVVGLNRYGVVSEIDGSLREDIASDSADTVFLELLDTFLDEWKTEHPDATEVEMRTTDWASLMSACEPIRALMRNYSKPTHLGHVFGRAKDNGYPFTRRRKTGGFFWTVPLDYRDQTKGES